MSRADELRQDIQNLMTEDYREAFPQTAFQPGHSSVPVSGRVFDKDDLHSLVDSSLDFWLTTGRFAEQFERAFSRRVGVREARLVNSGSNNVFWVGVYPGLSEAMIDYIAASLHGAAEAKCAVL